MTIEYSQHIEVRLRLRGIERALPERICREAAQRFLDTETSHRIAVDRAELYGKVRDVMVAYREEDGYVKLLTIHPLKDGQLENRLASGRWRAI